MSNDGSRSGSKTPPKKRAYPLKMETIPLSSSYTELKDNGMSEGGEINGTTSISHHADEENYTPNVVNYEADDDFKFKRHKSKHINGVPSLGERLDNLQDIKKAKWIDNFNSSMPLHQTDRASNDVSDIPITNNAQDNQTSQPSNPQQLQPHYMPYMYYYPMPTPGHPMMPYMGSPIHSSQLERNQYVNSSVSMLPNTSLQPFMPPASVPPSNYNNVDVPHLLPPPPLYPYGLFQSQNQQQQHSQTQPQPHFIHKSKERRRSTTFNRGRRLSMLASTNDHNLIVSPHKDVPEEDFYRHVGDTSFGKGLQMRQLFNWCMIRSLRNMEKPQDGNSHSETKKDEYVDPKKIAMVIIEEFVNDLRKGTTDIDWELEELSSNEDDAEGEDTELRNLFEDDENQSQDDIEVKRPKSSTTRRTLKRSANKRIKIINSKNIANAKNLDSLQSRIDILEKEVEDWAHVLDNSKVGEEWEELGNHSRTPHPESVYTEDNNALDLVQQQLVTKMDRLHMHCHFLQSSSQALSQLSTRKVKDLSRIFITAIDNNAEQISTKSLLKGISKSLLE